MQGNESEEWLQPVKQAKLYLEVIRMIRDQIFNGRIKPGELLPSGREFSEKLKVSRAVVREAMRALELAGVAEVRSGGVRAKIKKHNRLILLEFIDTLLGSKINVLKDLLEMRLLIDPIMARLAAEKADKEDIGLLKGSIQEMEADINLGNPGSLGAANFHYFIARSTHNKVAMRIMGTLISISGEIKALSFRTSGRPRVSLSQHKAILEAISERDANRAESVMQEHFITLKEDINQALVAYTDETPPASFNLLQNRKNRG